MMGAQLMVFFGTASLALLLLPAGGQGCLGAGGVSRRLRPAGQKLAVIKRYFRLPKRSSGRNDHDVRLLITQVAALLSAGAPPGAAWRRAAGVRVDSLGVPDVVGLTALFGSEAAVAMVAATRLAQSLGAPLAAVLHASGRVLAAEAEADAERAAIMAGPQTTARVLLCLPALGLAIGWLLGAHPIQTAINGGMGTWSMISGLLLLVLGRGWISRLIASAARPSAARPSAARTPAARLSAANRVKANGSSSSIAVVRSGR